MHISSTPRFQRTFSAMSKAVQRDAQKALKVFQKDPRTTKLKVHKLKGRLKGSYAFSINYSHRIIFEFISRTEVVLLDIGTHDIYE